MDNRKSNVRVMPDRRGESARTAGGTGTVRSRVRNSIRYFDYSLVASIVFLICFGLVMLYSASAYAAQVDYGDSMYYFKRQIVFSAVGAVIAYVASQINYHAWSRYAKKIYFLAIILMALVQTPLGKEVNGARRWLRLPFGQQLQPSELAKIAVILFVPVVICQMGRQIRRLENVVRVLCWGAAAAACVFFLTENLSTAIIVFGISFLLIFIVHPKKMIFIVPVVVGVILVLVIPMLLGPLVEAGDFSGNFRLGRLLVWLDPEKYSSGLGYQVVQGLYAVGSGGFFGKGLGNSAQKQFIPEVQNDMILSVICEELGVFGAIMVLLLFGLLLYRLMVIAQNAPDMYGALIASGIFAHIALQVILNVAVVINLIPNTGITLPFISYGGTSVLFLMAEMGIALGISRQIKMR